MPKLGKQERKVLRGVALTIAEEWRDVAHELDPRTVPQKAPVQLAIGPIAEAIVLGSKFMQALQTETMDSDDLFGSPL